MRRVRYRSPCWRALRSRKRAVSKYVVWRYWPWKSGSKTSGGRNWHIAAVAAGRSPRGTAQVPTFERRSLAGTESIRGNFSAPRPSGSGRHARFPAIAAGWRFKGFRLTDHLPLRYLGRVVGVGGLEG